MVTVQVFPIDYELSVKNINSLLFFTKFQTQTQTLKTTQILTFAQKLN